MKINRRVGLTLGAILVMVCSKVGLLVADVVPFNSDEAVIALMARHITQGARPVFFYGQAYMGSLDAFLIAIGFLILGEYVWVVRLVQIMLYVSTLVSTVFVGKEVFGNWRVGILAAWFLAIPTVNVTLYTTVTLGGYGEMLLIGNLIILAGLRIAYHEYIKVVDSVNWLWLLWGFLVGLGLWIFGFTLVYSVPVGLFIIWTVWKHIQGNIVEDTRGKKWLLWRYLGKVLPLVILGLILGAAPWIWFALQKGVGSLIGELKGGAIAGVEGLPWIDQVFRHIINLMLLGTTVVFGLRPPWEFRWLALPLLPFALMFWIGVLIFMVRILKRVWSNQAPVAVLVGICLSLVISFIFTPFGADPSGRYFLPLVVPLSLFAAEMILYLEKRIGKWSWGLVGLILVFNLWGTVQSAMNFPPGLTTQFDAVTQIDHSYEGELISFLLESGEFFGYSNYWVAYPLAFNSQEELIFQPRLPYHLDFRYTERDDRYKSYGDMLYEAERVAYITTNNPPLNEYLRDRFTGLKLTWQETDIGDYYIFYDLSRIIRPQDVGLEDMTP